MPKLKMYRGLPGSGKTTQARAEVVTSGNAGRVNRDDLRREKRTMLQIQPRRDFWDIPYSVLANDQGVVAVMRDERYTRLFAGADELRSQLLAADVEKFVKELQDIRESEAAAKEGQ